MQRAAMRAILTTERAGARWQPGWRARAEGRADAPGTGRCRGRPWEKRGGSPGWSGGPPEWLCRLPGWSGEPMRWPLGSASLIWMKRVIQGVYSLYYAFARFPFGHQGGGHGAHHSKPKEAEGVEDQEMSQQSMWILE